MMIKNDACTQLPVRTLKCICAVLLSGKHKGRMAQSNSFLYEILEGTTNLINTADEIKKNYISLISRIKETKNLVWNVYEKLSWVLGCFLDPEEGYVLLARQLAGLSLLVTDILKLKAEIPKEMVPQIERLEECIEKAKQALQNMRIRLEPLFKVWSNITLYVIYYLISYRTENVWIKNKYQPLVKSNWWSIINVEFWLVELLLGYML